jgi:hypothetical protein
MGTGILAESINPILFCSRMDGTSCANAVDAIIITTLVSKYFKRIN